MKILQAKHAMHEAFSILSYRLRRFIESKIRMMRATAEAFTFSMYHVRIGHLQCHDVEEVGKIQLGGNIHEPS